ncbi:MAG TPA: DUF1345 domain-containing protein [Acetobacteraceae bacterium]|jgi:uncharacterized membrane protein|nr:DUF1345 domain-containing protein [Acetobacteraceae bacterium]
MRGLELWPVRVVAGHRYTFSAALIGAASFALLPGELSLPARAVFAWDIGAVALLGMFAGMLMTEGDDAAMARNAQEQQEGEWTVFGITLASVAVSFASLTKVLGAAKDMPGPERKLYVAAAALTLFLSWLVTQVLFALRYAHEYYERQPGAARVDDGLAFPGDAPPDYWDFFYFAMVLGMTFQVSDVQIVSRKMRRLATAHGLIGFLFNAVIIALTVNIAASLL